MMGSAFLELGQDPRRFLLVDDRHASLPCLANMTDMRGARRPTCPMSAERLVPTPSVICLTGMRFPCRQFLPGKCVAEKNDTRRVQTVPHAKFRVLKLSFLPRLEG